MLWTWGAATSGRRPASTATRTRRSVDQGQTISMPTEKDLFFPPEDEEYASQYMPNAEFG